MGTRQHRHPRTRARLDVAPPGDEQNAAAPSPSAPAARLRKALGRAGGGQSGTSTIQPASGETLEMSVVLPKLTQLCHICNGGPRLEVPAPNNAETRIFMFLLHAMGKGPIRHPTAKSVFN